MGVGQGWGPAGDWVSGTGQPGSRHGHSCPELGCQAKSFSAIVADLEVIIKQYLRDVYTAWDIYMRFPPARKHRYAT